MEKISIRIPEGKKNVLARIAARENKTLSDYVRDVIFNPVFTTKADTIDIPQSQYIITRLLLLVLAQHMEQEQVMEYYSVCMKDAESKFGREQHERL